MDTIKFIAKDQNQKDFASELNKRIRKYFKTNKLSTSGGYRLMLKAFILLSIYFSVLLIFFTQEISIWLAVGLCILLGISKAGIGMSVMHDASHGSFSKHQWVNKLMSKSMYLLGSSIVTWNIQHNVLHHTYPNVHEWDRDIDSKGLKLTSHSDQKSRIFRHQHIFGPFLYSLMTLVRFVSDFNHLKLYKDMGALKMAKTSYIRAFLELIVVKVIYLGVFIVLPFVLTDFLWWQILLGFLLVQFIGSLIMGTVFQLAHIVENLDEPTANSDGEIHEQYAVHQLNTTSDFGRKNGLFSWYIGGLNYQVEHHLFPHICHVHYAKLSSIVAQTAKEFNQPYHCEKSAYTAFRSHLRRLKSLGRHM